VLINNIIILPFLGIIIILAVIAFTYVNVDNRSFKLTTLFRMVLELILSLWVLFNIRVIDSLIDVIGPIITDIEPTIDKIDTIIHNDVYKIAIPIFFGFFLWNRKSPQRVLIVTVQDCPEDNLDCNDVNMGPFLNLDPFQVVFVKATGNQIMAHFYMPGGWPYILQHINWLHVSIINKQNHVDLIYSVAEHPVTGRGGAVILNSVIKDANHQLMDMICLLRKMESFYIEFHNQAYTRKPEYKYESE
jgi:hypothetical protein